MLLLAGGAAWLLSASSAATALWIAGTVLGLVFSVGWTVAAVRQGQLSVDVIAVLALAGALVVNEPFAGAMITVMLASGQLLEARAAARANHPPTTTAIRASSTPPIRVIQGLRGPDLARDFNVLITVPTNVEASRACTQVTVAEKPVIAGR